jgi:hypothetical protein
LADQFGTADILTLDRDFAIYRWGKNKPFRVLPSADLHGPRESPSVGDRRVFLCLTGPRNPLDSARPMPCYFASHPQETRTRKSPFQCSGASPTKRRVPMDKKDRIPTNNMRCPCSRSGAPKQSSKQNAHRVTHNPTLAPPGAVSRAVLESYSQACCQIFV